MNKLRHWQDGVNILIGFWLIVSPWALGFENQPVMVANFVGAGLALFALALGALFVPHAWEEWTACALGMWIVASPWFLEFAHDLAATRNALASGAVVILMSIWSLLAYEEFALWRGPTTR